MQWDTLCLATCENTIAAHFPRPPYTDLTTLSWMLVPPASLMSSGARAAAAGAVTCDIDEKGDSIAPLLTPLPLALRPTPCLLRPGEPASSSGGGERMVPVGRSSAVLLLLLPLGTSLAGNGESRLDDGDGSLPPLLVMVTAELLLDSAPPQP